MSLTLMACYGAPQVMGPMPPEDTSASPSATPATSSAPLAK